MNSFLMPLAQMLAMSEGAGGLFDFNATLPIMALQFIALTTILTSPIFFLEISQYLLVMFPQPQCQKHIHIF